MSRIELTVINPIFKDGKQIGVATNDAGMDFGPATAIRPLSLRSGRPVRNMDNIQPSSDYVVIRR